MAIEMTSHTIVQKLYDELRPRIEALTEAGHQPALAVILIGHDPMSELYVSSIKQKQAENLGIDFTVHRFDENVAEEKIIGAIQQFNSQPAVSGLIIQLPLPEAVNTEEVLTAVALEKDVDGLRAGSQFVPPTVNAILELLEAYDIQLKDKKIVIVGRGRLVGSPLEKALKELKLDITVCDQTIEDLAGCTLNADILISATGESGLIKPPMVKDGAVVIDVDNDVVYDQIASKASAITPQKGGVGPLTVAFLLSNVVEAAEKQHA